MDWNNKYTCENWAEKFKLTYPILDDSRGNRIYNYFGNGVVPFNIVLDKDRRVIYTSSGFNTEEIIEAINIHFVLLSYLIAPFSQYITGQKIIPIPVLFLVY